MVITESFIYIHMPKTGGTFVETVLRRVLEQRGEGFIDTSIAADRTRLGASDQHGTVAKIPREHRGKPVLASVRNPYEHLISFFEFGWWRDHPNDTFDETAIRDRYPHYPDLSFEQYVEAIYEWRALAKTHIVPELERALRAADVGPTTFDYFRFLAQDPGETIRSLARIDVANALAAATSDVRFLRCESLNHDLCEALVEKGYSWKAVGFVLDLEPIRPYGSTRGRSRSRRWQEYYSAPLKRLVRRKERALFTLFPEYDV